LLSPVESRRSAGLFVTSSGTSAGKTCVARGIVHALALRGLRVAGLKPIETGCAPYPADALALARAAGDLALADAEGWYRAAAPLSPYAVELSVGQQPPDLRAIGASVARCHAAHDYVVVEGAGGLLVPLDRHRSMADLALMLGYPLLLVADDRLGVLSHVLAVLEAALHRRLPVAAIVLSHPAPSDPGDRSAETNHAILAERTGLPVITFPHVRDDDASLAAAIERSALLAHLGWSNAR
jgi:dethiobiotin synthetase